MKTASPEVRSIAIKAAKRGKAREIGVGGLYGSRCLSRTDKDSSDRRVFEPYGWRQLPMSAVSDYFQAKNAVKERL